MTTESPITAFFYQNPVVLDRVQHKALRVKPGNALFASKNQSVPLVAGEFPEACLEYPIVFTKGQDGQWLALALTGLKVGTNAFVNAQGQWLGRYVPASVRRYPFILAEANKEQLSLGIDLAAPQVGAEGEQVFTEQGEPTEFVQKWMPMLVDFQNQATLTSALLKNLEDAGLLTQKNMQVTSGQQRQAVVEGVWIVDEEKLRELPDEQVLAWFRGGELALIHAHMISLRNLMPLLDRSFEELESKPAAKAKAKGKAS